MHRAPPCALLMIALGLWAAPTLAQTLDPVTFSVDPFFSDERNTLGLMGSGPIEMLGREMTRDLFVIRDATILLRDGEPVIDRFPSRSRIRRFHARPFR